MAKLGGLGGGYVRTGVFGKTPPNHRPALLAMIAPGTQDNQALVEGARRESVEPDQLVKVSTVAPQMVQGRDFQVSFRQIDGQMMVGYVHSNITQQSLLLDANRQVIVDVKTGEGILTLKEAVGLTTDL